MKVTHHLHCLFPRQLHQGRDFHLGHSQCTLKAQLSIRNTVGVEEMIFAFSTSCLACSRVSYSLSTEDGLSSILLKDSGRFEIQDLSLVASQVMQVESKKVGEGRRAPPGTDTLFPAVPPLPCCLGLMDSLQANPQASHPLPWHVCQHPWGKEFGKGRKRKKRKPGARGRFPHLCK